jgi:hypothetical protein
MGFTHCLAKRKRVMGFINRLTKRMRRMDFIWAVAERKSFMADFMLIPLTRRELFSLLEA